MLRFCWLKHKCHQMMCLFWSIFIQNLMLAYCQLNIKEKISLKKLHLNRFLQNFGHFFYISVLMLSCVLSHKGYVVFTFHFNERKKEEMSHPSPWQVIPPGPPVTDRRTKAEWQETSCWKGRCHMRVMPTQVGEVSWTISCLNIYTCTICVLRMTVCVLDTNF